MKRNEAVHAAREAGLIVVLELVAEELKTDGAGLKYRPTETVYLPGPKLGWAIRQEESQR